MPGSFEYDYSSPLAELDCEEARGLARAALDRLTDTSTVTDASDLAHLQRFVDCQSMNVAVAIIDREGWITLDIEGIRNTLGVVGIKDKDPVT